MAGYTGTVMRRVLEVNALYTIHYFEYFKGYSFKGESHDFWEFIYADRGALEVQAGEKRFILQQGQLLFHPPGEFHTVATAGDGVANAIVISFECRADELAVLAGRAITVLTGERQLMSGIVEDARAAFENDLGDPGYTALIRTGGGDYACEQHILLMLETLLIRLIRRSAAGSSNKPEGRATGAEHFAMAARYIERNLDTAFSLDMLCAEVGISPAHLERLCRRATGMSVIQYCRARRIARARELLREGSMSVTAIAAATGFSSVHYFSRAFKQAVGMSPSDYVRSIKSMTDRPAGETYPDIYTRAK